MIPMKQIYELDGEGSLCYAPPCDKTNRWDLDCSTRKRLEPQDRCLDHNHRHRNPPAGHGFGMGSDDRLRKPANPHVQNREVPSALDKADTHVDAEDAF